jgi:hypothetical protein
MKATVNDSDMLLPIYRTYVLVPPCVLACYMSRLSDLITYSQEQLPITRRVKYFEASYYENKISSGHAIRYSGHQEPPSYPNNAWYPHSSFSGCICAVGSFPSNPPPQNYSTDAHNNDA